MTDNSARRVLVVAGDYAVIEQVQQALQSDLFALQRAYTHRDALYALAQAPFDIALVDAAMFDRHSSTTTMHAVAEFDSDLPLIVVNTNGERELALPDRALAVSLNQDAILKNVSDALELFTYVGTDLSQTAYLSAGASQQRIEEIETLFALSRSLTEVLDLNQVLNRVVEAARHLTDAEEGMILLPDEEGGELYLRAKVGIDVEVARNFRVKTKDTLAGHVFDTGQPVLIGAQGPQKVKTEYFVNALLYVPILLKGRPIGVLGVNNKTREDVFDLRHKELLLNLASYAAIAIENARNHEDSIQQSRKLRILVEASQIVNSSLALDTTLPNICEQLVRVLNVSVSEIYEWHGASHQLRTLARYQRAIWRPGNEPVISLADYPILRAALHNNRPVLVTGENAGSSGDARYVQQVGAQAMFIVPVKAGEQLLGAIQAFYITTPGEQPLAPGTFHRIQNLGLEALVAVSDQGQATQNAFRIAEEINRLAGADWCELSLLAPDGYTFKVHVALGRGVWLNEPQPCIDLLQYPDLLEAVLSQLPFSQRADTKSLAPGAAVLLKMTRSRVILGLPLVQRGQAFGWVLFADTMRNRVFDKSELDMGQAIVGQAATALENARLVHDLEASLQELKDTQERLVQTARLSAMGELAAAVAHQINNPLTTIVVDSELLMLDAEPDSPHYHSLLAISRAGKRAAGVVRRLLATARPNDPGTPDQPIDVVDTIQGILSLVQSHIERDRIRVKANLPAQPLPPVMSAEGQLDDVWLNLLLNAHDALVGRQGAEIGIEVFYKPDNEYIDVVVWDNGPGIPEDILPEIFNPFFTTKPVGEGTGLGLHICRQVVDRVGGRISVESAPDAGTRFLVRLPVAKGE